MANILPSVDGCLSSGLHPRLASTVDLPPLSPRITELLLCNDAPCDSELDRIHETRKVHERRLHLLEEQIQATQDALERLTREQERDRVTQELENYRIVSSPVRRLPSEILSELFLWCRGGDEFGSIPSLSGSKRNIDSLDLTHAPWTLVRVCSRWMSIGNALPMLWSSITVDFDTVVRKRPHSTSLLLNLHLQRSGTCLLTVWLRSRKRPIPSDNSLLSVLLPSSYRWKCAEFEVDRPSLQRLSPLRGSLPVLQKLIVKVVPRDGAIQTAKIDIFEFAPHLRSFQAKAITDIDDKWVIPWCQLSSYGWLEWATRPSIPHLGILHRTPNLEMLEVDCQPMVDPGTTATLSKLTRLCLYEAPTGGLDGLMRHLVLPALDVCYLQGYPVSSDLDCLVDLVNRSQCRLARLTLSVSISGEAWLRVLQALPTLRHLVVVSGNLTVEVVNRMIFRPTDTETPLLPALEHLNLTECLLFDAAAAALLADMVESRAYNGVVGADSAPRNTVTALKTLKIAPRIAFSADVKLRLEQSTSLQELPWNHPDARTFE